MVVRTSSEPELANRHFLVRLNGADYQSGRVRSANLNRTRLSDPAAAFSVQGSFFVRIVTPFPWVHSRFEEVIAASVPWSNPPRQF
jgi:hypothetical protein